MRSFAFNFFLSIAMSARTEDQVATSQHTVGHTSPSNIELQDVQATSQERENHSELQDDSNVLNRKNIIKILVAGFSFFFSGLNDGSLGALTPYILRTYHVGTEYVALLYRPFPPAHLVTTLVLISNQICLDLPRMASRCYDEQPPHQLS